MAKFGRFDARNKKKGKNKSYSRDEKDLRIKRVEPKRKPKINQALVNKISYEYIDPTEEI